jgi:hypothetical protein
VTSKELFAWGCVAMVVGVLGLSTCGIDPAATRLPEASTRPTRQPITQARETSSAPRQVPLQALLGSWHDGHDGCAYLSEGDSDLSIQLQVWTCSLGGQTSADALLTRVGPEYRGSGDVVRLVPRQDGSLSVMVTSQWVDKEGKPYGPGESRSAVPRQGNSSSQKVSGSPVKSAKLRLLIRRSLVRAQVGEPR